MKAGNDAELLYNVMERKEIMKTGPYEVSWKTKGEGRQTRNSARDVGEGNDAALALCIT